VIALCAGAAVLMWLLLRDRFGTIVTAMHGIGAAGFALMIALHLLLILPLGAAWSMLARGTPEAGLWRFVWGRLIRDSAGEVLPLSQLGGHVLGARAVQLCGVSGTFAAASTVVDLAVEFTARLPYMALGLGLLVWLKPDSELIWPCVIAGLIMTLMAVLLVASLIRGPAFLDRVAPRLAPRWASAAGGLPSRLRATIEAILSRRGGLARAALLHASAWMLSALELWLPFRFMHAGLGLPEVIAIDGLVSGLRSFVFFIPGALGLQEGAYVVACGLFGVPPAVALAASLLRRGRDIAIAVPALMSWQVVEGRRVWQDAAVNELVVTEPAITPHSG
jgi:putative membrane protein